MLKRVVVVFLVMVFSGGVLSAQTPAASKPKPDTPKAEASTPKPAPEPPAFPVNIRIEVSITDQTGTNPAAKKVVTMIAADRQSTSIRSSASVPVKLAGMQTFNYRNVTINVDARPAIIPKEPTKMTVNFGLEYFPKSRNENEESEPGMAQINERLGLILESGKPLIISQAADPASDRKITVEVTATILK